MAKKTDSEAVVATPRKPRVEEKFCPVTVGESYIFRTVTFYQIGKVVDVRGNYVILNDTVWVADMGRFDEALKDGTLREAVAVPTNKHDSEGWCAVNLDSVVDIFKWRHGKRVSTES